MVVNNILLPILVVTLLIPILVSIKSFWFGWDRSDSRMFIIVSLLVSYAVIVVRFVLIILGVLSHDDYM